MREWIAPALALMAAMVVTAPAQGELRGGAARVDLTPPMALKCSLGGYGERMNRPAVGVHDRVFAKALVLEDGAKRYAFVTADVLGFPPGVKSAVVAALAKEGWKDEQILLLPSHSHTSIDISTLNPKNDLGIPQIGLFNQAVFDLTVANLAKVITAASKDLVPVVVGTDQMTLPAGWTHNRRAGNTYTNPLLTVTRVDTLDGKPLAALVNWATHPTFMGPEDMLFSGDWPGHLQRTLELLIGNGVTAMYYNGAQGDQAPSRRGDIESHWEKAERYGDELGIIAFHLWEKIKPHRVTVFAYHTEPIQMPERTWHPDFMRTGGAEYGMSPQTIRDLIHRTVPTTSHNNAVRLDDLVIVGVPGEMAAQLGANVEGRVRLDLGVKYAVIGGLADEWLSYILSEEEYAKGGGYEASMSFYGRSLGTKMVESAINCADKLKGAK